MGIVLALGAAVAYGLSDFIGGLASRRTSAWPVALLASVGGLAGAVVLALAVPGDPTSGDLVWGAASGLGSGAGSAFLYRGFAAGRMSVVAPVSAVGAAIVPVAVGLATGERPSWLVMVGIVVALPAIWLVARTPDEPLDDGAQETLAAGLVDGLLAGLGFGLLFVAIGQVPDGAGFWPIASAQVVGLVTIAVLATALRVQWVPTAGSEWWGAAAGLMASLALLMFLLATQADLLTVAAVLTSLYPAFTILLAAVVLREHIYRAQGVGLLLCGIAVGFVAAG
ncbi:EamA family transporter [Nocardioides silvaticus]|uniref:EamA family transporter n=1 Tax=Nocardioides silvaticus TaxID=2201891 RepID=A0A316TB72_9ACTN|nr:EamA family transporter [Nocardioides silvaticus]PWN00988.1 EamA family transporter [Nocardioides silvaticus]